MKNGVGMSMNLCIRIEMSLYALFYLLIIIPEDLILIMINNEEVTIDEKLYALKNQSVLLR